MKYGFQYPTIQPKDYVLGASRSAPFEVINESGDWTAYLPDNEVQSRAGFDSNSCTAFGSTNLLEITQRYLQQIKTNYSERYVAVNSGQVRQGNDPHKVLEAIRSLGVVEDWKLPFLEGMTWETYFFPVPMNTELLNDGKEWVNQYYFKHEYIYPIGAPIKERQELLLEALKRSPVGVSVYAWNFDGEEYVKPDDAKDNHWTVLVGAKKGEYWLVYDSYENDGNFLKKLDWNSPFFDVAKGIYLRKKTEQERNEELSVFVKIFTAILNIFKLLADKKKAEEAPKTPVPEEPPVVSHPTATIDGLARAIALHENVNVAHNNPGGLRSSPFQNGFITQSTTGKKLATFATYADGWKALIHQITIVCNGTSPVYTAEAKKLGLTTCGDLTIGQFIHIYAPRYENDSERYISVIEKTAKVARSVKMKELL